MKRLFLALALVSLVFCVACGSSPTLGIGTGHYSNASLTGSYVYQISGIDLNGNLYSEAGIFAANGKGVIQSGVDDAAEFSQTAFGNSTTGSYSIASDGTGTITLNNTAFGTINWSVTLVSASKLYLIEADALNATGVAEVQTAQALPAVTSTFVFKQHGVSATQDFSTVGQFSLATTGSLTGSDDVNRGGTVNGGGGTGSPLTLTGASSLAAPDSTGRGTGTIVDSTGTTDFFYYIVDNNNLRFLLNDTGVVGIGRAEAQAGAPFTTDPLSGNSYAFGSRGDDNNAGTGAVNSVGSFTASGGSITGGVLDSAVDAVTSYSNVAINSGGSYTAVAANGRTVVSTTTGIPSTVQQVFWMVNPSRAFFLTTSDSSDVTKIEDGTADQQMGNFTNATLNSQSAFSMDGYDSNSGFDVDRVGWIQWNGSGSLVWNEAVNDSGSISGATLSGTYSVGSNGRTTATVNNLSYQNNDIVFYLVSSGNAYILENDPGVEINGMMSQQQ